MSSSWQWACALPWAPSHRSRSRNAPSSLELATVSAWFFFCFNFFAGLAHTGPVPQTALSLFVPLPFYTLLLLLRALKSTNPHDRHRPGCLNCVAIISIRALALLNLLLLLRALKSTKPHDVDAGVSLSASRACHPCRRHGVGGAMRLVGGSARVSVTHTTRSAIWCARRCTFWLYESRARLSHTTVHGDMALRVLDTGGGRVRNWGRDAGRGC